MDKVGKIFRVEQGMRRCCVCEELFTAPAAGQHFNEPCQPKPEAAKAAAAGQSR
jgi:hypothetical protein